MNHFTSFVTFLLVIMLAGQTGCKQEKKQVEEIKQTDSGKILFVTEAYPPYEYLENGILKGYDIDVLEEAAKLAGIEYEINLVPWKRAITMVKDGSAAAIFCLFKTPEREEFLYFPEVPLSIEINRLFANKHFTGDIWKISDLKGKTVGTVADYSYGKEFDAYENVIKETASNQEILFKKLQGNRYSLIVNNELVTWYKIRELGMEEENFRPLGLIVSREPLYIAFSKKHPRGKELAKKMGAAFNKMADEGILENFREKYRR